LLSGKYRSGTAGETYRGLQDCLATFSVAHPERPFTLAACDHSSRTPRAPGMRREPGSPGNFASCWAVHTARAWQAKFHGVLQPAAAQKKPRFRGVSVACLCVEECRSRYYPVCAVSGEPGGSCPIRTFFQLSLCRLPSRLLPMMGIEEQHSCQLAPTAQSAPPERSGVDTNVTQCTLLTRSVTDPQPPRAL